MRVGDRREQNDALTTVEMVLRKQENGRASARA
jgi:hypothetical protein